MYHLLLFLLSLLICGAGCSDDALWGEGGSNGDNGGGTEPPPGGGETPEFQIYGVNVFTGALFTINPDNGRLDLIGPLDPDREMFNFPSGMAVRASDDAIFVWNNADEVQTITGVLLRVDRCTGVGTPVNPNLAPQGQLDAIAFQGSRLYGVGPAAGSTTNYTLYEIITSTGVRTLVGGTFPRMAGLAADPFRTLHGLEQVAEGAGPLGLYMIDTVGASAARIADLDDRLVSGASLAFDDDVLLGTGQHRNGDSLFFEINPTTGAISNVVILEQVVQGIGVSATCESTQGAMRN